MGSLFWSAFRQLPRQQMSHNQNLAQKWSTQHHASRIKKADLRSYLWQGDSPLASNYPGFEDVAQMTVGQNPVPPVNIPIPTKID